MKNNLFTPLLARCPVCRAIEWRGCKKRTTGKPTSPHMARLKAAREVYWSKKP